jgi:hypothetical protein
MARHGGDLVARIPAEIERLERHLEIIAGYGDSSVSPAVATVPAADRSAPRQVQAVSRTARRRA